MKLRLEKEIKNRSPYPSNRKYFSDVGFCVRLEEIGWPIESIRDDRNSSSWMNSGPIGSNLEDPSASSRSSILITEFLPIR